MNMTEIGMAIRHARKDAKLTQQQLGELLGMSRATISGIETGRIAEVGIRKMAALCSALDLEITVGKRRPYPTLQELRQEQRGKSRA
ncbi:MAG: XRE family transcriptional regulator [Oxalobacteraceae bacterium]|jgi:transcriptional regulator with XRE-family HTH domain|nr:MAG: XRE family transcriptional regulator [Oxalobacteraceae bacterium]